MTKAAKKLIALMLLDVEQLMNALESGAATVAAWRRQFAKYLAQYHTAEYMVGQKGRELNKAGRTFLGDTVEAQIGFLNNWAAEIQSAAEYQKSWNARAAMYAQGIKQSYWKGATKMLPLPAMPADGTTQCLTNCTCSWEITELDGDGNYDCTWVMGAVEHCQTCAQRAEEWAPLKIRNGEVL